MKQAKVARHCTTSFPSGSPGEPNKEASGVVVTFTADGSSHRFSHGLHKRFQRSTARHVPDVAQGLEPRRHMLAGIAVKARSAKMSSFARPDARQLNTVMTDAVPHTERIVCCQYDIYSFFYCPTARRRLNPSYAHPHAWALLRVCAGLASALGRASSADRCLARSKFLGLLSLPPKASEGFSSFISPILALRKLNSLNSFLLTTLQVTAGRLLTSFWKWPPRRVRA